MKRLSSRMGTTTIAFTMSGRFTCEKGGAVVMEQLTIFDWIPELHKEPEVGELIKEPGAIIPHIMRSGYIGQKVCFDCSTQSRRAYRVGILEAVNQSHYWHLEGEEYKQIPCDRVVIFTGKKQRSLISLMPGTEIYECLPWDAYPKRMEAIYGHHKEH